MKTHYHDRDTTCLKCPVACGKQYAINEGEFAGTKAKMPEYETIFALGPMLGISNPEALILRERSLRPCSGWTRSRSA